MEPDRTTRCSNWYYFHLVGLPVIACLIIAECGPGHLYDCGKYHKGHFEWYSRCLYVQMSVKTYCWSSSVTTVQVNIRIYDRFKDGHGPSIHWVFMGQNHNTMTSIVVGVHLQIWRNSKSAYRLREANTVYGGMLLPLKYSYAFFFCYILFASNELSHPLSQLCPNNDVMLFDDTWILCQLSVKEN